MFLVIIQQTSFSDKILQKVKLILNDLGFSNSRADVWDRVLILLFIILLAYLSYLFFSKVLIRLVHYIVTHTKTKWDLYLYRRKFFQRLFGFIPPLVVFILLPLAFSSDFKRFLNFLELLINIYLTIIGAKILISMVEAAFDYYLMKNELAASPYKGVVDMSRMFIQAITILAIIGLILNMKLSAVITGLSAFAAILVLVFKDTLLGFIAGIQLTKNQMIRIGDWITVPNSKADGNIIEINILTVKIQNFDNTFVYVPCYTLLTAPFQNWNGMIDSGVRRVSKAIRIDVSTIIKPDEALLDKIYADPYVKSFLGEKEYASFLACRAPGNPDSDTNLSLFRSWLKSYMTVHPDITNEPYLIVRDLPADGAGLPIELMFFVNTTIWADYERIQSLTFEQIMMMIPRFGLRQFQFNIWAESDANLQKGILSDNSRP